MTAYQVYEQAIKPLSVAEKLTLARLIINEVAPETGPQIESMGDNLNGNSPQSEPDPPAKARPPREFGGGRHLLAGVDIDALLATPIEDMFAEYMPEER